MSERLTRKPLTRLPETGERRAAAPRQNNTSALREWATQEANRPESRTLHSTMAHQAVQIAGIPSANGRQFASELARTLHETAAFELAVGALRLIGKGATAKLERQQLLLRGQYGQITGQQLRDLLHEELNQAFKAASMLAAAGIEASGGQPTQQATRVATTLGQQVGELAAHLLDEQLELSYHYDNSDVLSFADVRDLVRSEAPSNIPFEFEEPNGSPIDA